MNLKEILRRLRLQIGKFLLDKKSVGVGNNAVPPSKILFLRYDGKIGDYIVSSFVFREIKKQAPQTHIGVVCSRKNAYLFEENPYIDQLYFVRTKNIADYLRCGKRLAAERYDVVIDPTVLLRNRDLFFLRTIAATCYVGYEKTDYKLFDLNVRDEKQHFSSVYRQALALVGFNNIDTGYDVPLRAENHAAVKAWSAENGLEDFIALNLFGAGSARRFNEVKMREVLDYLTRNTPKPIVLLAFPDVMAKLVSLAAQFKGVFVYEKTRTIFDTIELIRFADLLISPDTSVVHIAAGLNKKIIALYSTDEQNFAHWHPNNRNETHILRFKQSVNEISATEINTAWLNG